MFWWIGVYASLLWAYNNFLESLLGIVWGTVCDYFRQDKLFQRYGPWAVITGATDGIGKRYAENLARKGFKIVLISRTEAKLIKVASEIEQKFGVETKWIAVDFSNKANIYDYLREQLASIEIGMLVNNVGFLPELDYFVEHTEADLLRLININIVPTTMLSRMVLPGMKQRRKGMIVNIASSSAYIPSSYMAAYGASKSYIVSLSIALQHELKGSGVECQVVTPSIVRTNMSQKYDNDTMPWYVFILDVDVLARFAVFTIGKTAETCGHWIHCVQTCWWPLIPKSIGVSLIGRVFFNGMSKTE